MGSIEADIRKCVSKPIDLVEMYIRLAKKYHVGPAEVRGKMWDLVGDGVIQIGPDLQLEPGPGKEQGALHR